MTLNSGKVMRSYAEEKHVYRILFQNVPLRPMRGLLFIGNIVLVFVICCRLQDFLVKPFGI